MLMVSSRQNPGELSDMDILAQVSAGNVDAYGKIVGRYNGRLYNFIYRFVGDRETAEDIVQETFLRADQNRAWRKRLQRRRGFFQQVLGRRGSGERGFQLFESRRARGEN